MDTTLQSTKGTSLEILAPYLPYGIEVESIGEAKREKLIGLAYNATELVNVEWQPLRNYWYGANHCLPVLRPFSALTTPLEGGEVPAVEVAKLIAGGRDWQVRDESLLQAGLAVLWDGASCRLIIKHIHNPEWGWHFDLYSMPSGTKLDALNIGAAYDYLRSKHFALPVNGQPLTEGTDFIAK